MLDFQHPWGWTSSAPFLCAVHCVATPAVAGVAPALADTPTVEWSLFTATVVLAAAALASGLRAHGDMRPLYAVLLGVGAWIASLLHVFHPVPDGITTMVTSLTTASGLLWNSRLHCGRSISCSTCAGEPGGKAFGSVSTRTQEPMVG